MPENNVKADLVAYRDAFSPENLEVDLSTLTDPEIVARYETMNAALAKGNRFGSEVLDYFGLLSLTEAAAYVANLKYLADIAQFRPDVNYFINALEIDYEALTLQEQRDLRTASTTIFNRLNALRTNTAYATVRLFFEEYYDLDFDAIDNFRTALNHNIECIELQAYKDYFDDIIANLVIPFEAEGSLPNDEFYALVNEFTSKYNAVVGSDASNVPFYTTAAKVEIFTEGTDYVGEYLDELYAERTARNLLDDSDQYYEYFNESRLALEVELLDKATLIAEFNAGYQKLQQINAYDEETRIRIFGDFYGTIVDFVDSLGYEIANRLEAQLNVAAERYYDYGGIKLINYKEVRDLIGMVEREYYAPIQNTPYNNSNIQTKYNWLDPALAEYDNFVANKGLIGPNGTGGHYKLEVEMPVRVVREDDVIRIISPDQDYVVTEDKLLSIIDKLDAFLNSQEFGKLIDYGIVEETTTGVTTTNTTMPPTTTTQPGTTGEPEETEPPVPPINVQLPEVNQAKLASLGTLVHFASSRASGVGHRIIADRADVLVAVLNYLLSALGDEVFMATLVDALGGLFDSDDDEEEPEDPEEPEEPEEPGEPGEPEEPEEPEEPSDVIYMVFKDILSDLISGLFTMDSVNSIVGTLYPELAATVKEQLDSAGSIISITASEIGLNIFPKDLANTINGTKYPGVKAALQSAGEDWSKLMNEDGDIMLNWGFEDGNREEWIEALASAMSGATALLKAAFGNREHKYTKEVKIIIVIASVVFTFTPNRGYDKAVMPLLETIGAPGIVPTSTFEGYCNNTTLNYTVVLNMLKAILNPLFDWIQINMANAPVSTILDFLPNLAYALEFGMIDKGFADLFDTVVTIKGTGLASSVNETLNVSEMLNPMDLLGGLDLDLSSVNGLFGGLINKLANEDRNTDGWVPPVDENGNPLPIYPDVEVDDTIKEILIGIAANPSDAIAAIVELLEPVKYDTFKLVYPMAEQAALAPPENQLVQVGYSQYWTKERADFVTENLSDFIDKLLQLLGLDSLEDMIDELLGESVYTQDNMTALAEMLTELLQDDDIGDILEIVAPLLGLDLSAWDYPEGYEFVWDFEDGDKDGFIAALVEFLAPAEPLLRLLLTGEDLQLLTLTTVYGYEGYRNGIIPILEALGIEGDQILSYDAYKAAADEDPANLLLNIVNPIFSLIDRIYADPVGTLFEVLPNVLYFVNSDLLNTCITNVLQPVYVLLDVIRPIYNVQLGLDLNVPELLTDLVADLGLRLPAIPDFYQIAAGTVTTYNSKAADIIDGDAVYIEGASSEFMTALLRYLVQSLFFRENMDILREALADATGLDGAGLMTVGLMLEAFSMYVNTPEGADMMLNVLYYLFYGTNTVMDDLGSFLGAFNGEVKKIFEMFANSESEELRQFGEAAKNILQQISGGIFDEGGIASGGLIKFFQQIIEFFKNFFKMFESLFR